MARIVSWFSCGAASALATKICNPDIIAYNDTGSEDIDNERFMRDCEAWFGKKITIVKSTKYATTWDVWEDKKYISGIAGAPCTRALKIDPRIKFQLPDDVHVFGYTCDKTDIARAEALREHYPELNIHTPLIEKSINKAACLAILQTAKIRPPAIYKKGFHNANCVPCCKATSPDYWALVRKEYPDEFGKMVNLSRRLGVRLSRIKGVRVFIDEIPAEQPTTEAIQPACDMLCQMAEHELLNRP